MNIPRYELHPFCTAFRRANACEKDEIAASMKSHGYDHEQPITLFGNLILDGGTRQHAAHEAGVEPAFTTFTGTDDEAMALVIRRNKARKHMTAGELDLALARLVTARRGHQPGRSANNGKPNDYVHHLASATKTATKTAEDAAKEAGRSQSSVMKARELVLRAAPNIIAMVESGELATATAADGVRGKSKEEQAQMTAADVRKANRARDKRDHDNVTPLRPPKEAATKTQKHPKPITADRPHWNISKLDIGAERIPGQPVQLWPAHVQRLQEAGIRITGVTGRVAAIAGTDLKQFADDVERLLAYHPVPGKTNGEERNFAKETKKSLALMEQHIDAAIDRFVGLREIFRSNRQSA